MRSLFVAGALLLSHSMKSQNDHGSDIKLLRPVPDIMILGGGSLIGRTGYDKANLSSREKSGYCIGLGIVQKLTLRWGVFAKLMLEKKGAKEVENYYQSPYSAYNTPTNIQPPIPTTATMEWDDYYVTVSLMPLYFIGKNRDLQIGIGPYYGKLQNSNYIFSVVQHGQIYLYQKSRDFDNKNYDLGFTISASYKMFIGKGKSLIFGSNYSRGLTGVDNFYAPISPIKNSILSLWLGYTLNHLRGGQ